MLSGRKAVLSRAMVAAGAKAPSQIGFRSGSWISGWPLTPRREATRGQWEMASGSARVAARRGRERGFTMVQSELARHEEADVGDAPAGLC